LIEDKVSIKRFLDDINAQIIDVANLDKEGLSFININTEEEFKNFKTEEKHVWIRNTGINDYSYNSRYPFGATRLPQIGKGIGEAIKISKKQQVKKIEIDVNTKKG